jgi:hypothetical protein
VKDKKRLSERILPKTKENTSQDRMWSVIRNKSKVDGRFTVRDLIVLTCNRKGEPNVSYVNARWFVNMLRRAGIVQPSQEGGRKVFWKLMKDIGPRRPYVSAKIKNH